jgi:flagellar biosynthesis protein FlhG
MDDATTSRPDDGRPSPLTAGQAALTDQAAGLRRLFAGRGRAWLALVSNPHVEACGVAVERLTSALAEQRRSLLVLDAGERSPAMPEAAVLGLEPCIERLSPRIGYLAGRGLPGLYLDTQGAAGGLLDALADAAPAADAMLVHASAAEVGRIFRGRVMRPVLLVSDEIDSVKHAYASLKLLQRRCGWSTFDLLMLAPPGRLRPQRAVQSMAECAERFIGVALHDWAQVDPRVAPQRAPGAELHRMVAAQLRVDEAQASPHVSMAADPGLPAAPSLSHRSAANRPGTAGR